MTAGPLTHGRARGVLALLGALQRAAALAHDEGRDEMSRALFEFSEQLRREVFPDNPPLDPRYEHEDERKG